MTWQHVKLSDVCNFSSEKIEVSKLSLNNYISTENMLPNKAGVCCSANLPNTFHAVAFHVGNILVSNIRPYFKKIWYADFNGGCSNDVLVFQANENIDKSFLYYVLSSDSFVDYDVAMAKGTKMPRGDKAAIMQYQFLLPPLDIQKKIAAVLCALDDKIELNNKINSNLEQQAQALFKSWFIDFEPFGGVMPKDWKIGTFSEIIIDTIGGDWGKDKIQNNYTEEVYCIRGADIPDVKIGSKGKMPKRYILIKNYSSKKLLAGDLVVEISGGSPTQSTGRIAAISDYLLSRYNDKIICTNFCRALKPKQNYSEFIYHYWQYLYDKNVFFSYENGTTGIKNLDISGFLETEQINIPSYESLKTFSELCDKFFKQIYSNGAENEKLSALRDTLLPKLMKGEIDVSAVPLPTSCVSDCHGDKSPCNDAGSLSANKLSISEASQ
ncbi:MAG: restriction endonuclease subunit S [Elusimicrobiales bacterium]|nr:restriction endonuclease subunit S [Elusimicrobiales bacterium]